MYYLFVIRTRSYFCKRKDMTTQREEDLQWSATPPETLLETSLMNVLTSQVLCKRSGITKTFFRLDFTPWVNIVAVTPEDEIVLIRQYRFGTGRSEIEIPGGAVEKDEDPLAAGLRELQEETGYTGENARIIGRVCPNPAIQSNLCYTVLVDNAKKTSAQRLDDMEDIEVYTEPVNRLSRLITCGTIEHGLVLNALLFLFMERSNLLKND